MAWAITRFPACTHHVFLSHSSVDKSDLVYPVHHRLEAAGVSPWIDRHHFAYGRDSLAALREGVLACRHVVFFITPALLSNARGWCAAELAYSGIVQGNLLGDGDALVNVILPLILVPNPADVLPHTVWRTVWDRGPVYDPTPGVDPTTWAVAAILRFLRDEERLAKQHARLTRQDANLRRTVDRVPGLRKRVTQFDPQPLPPET